METNLFRNRHIGISKEQQQEMLHTIGVSSLDELIEQTLPQGIRLKKPLNLPQAMSEQEYSEHIQSIASKNKLLDTYIGLGWYETITPAAIYRNVFENPVWYTSYTPYQAEISQGRLEALYNFQTVVSELTSLPLANCSLLDEATAAAEAVTMMFNMRSRTQVKNGVNKVLVDKQIFPQTLDVLHTRASAQGIEIVLDDTLTTHLDDTFFGVVVQYPNGIGGVEDYRSLVEKAHALDTKVAVATDLMALVLLEAPGKWGADIAFGSSQRFGIPMFYGGPSAAFFATQEVNKRLMPGRIIGLSKDAYGKPALRMALQTREQHIKREKATSNICTAQALLATMASFYAVYHGAEGLKEIATRIHTTATLISQTLEKWGYVQNNKYFFDTLKITLPTALKSSQLKQMAEDHGVNLRYFETEEHVGISIGEINTPKRVNTLLHLFAQAVGQQHNPIDEEALSAQQVSIPNHLLRKDAILQYEVFTKYHTETELMRYIKRLERRDLSLAHAMIPLGSCTMKLNAASELLPLGLSGLQHVHPFAPQNQAKGYLELINNLGNYLAEITGFSRVSFQPNSGAAGEYAGLMTIKAYLQSKGENQRNLVLIPASAHGTNPASAAQAGFEIKVVACDPFGNVEIDDLRAKAEENKEHLAAFMITYPSTNGIFEEGIREMIDIVHENGGQVYMDGANMNAQVGLTNSGFIGADVCHLNLHKTFAIPHGGGGPGQGPICVAEHLVPFIPHHMALDGESLNAVSSAPYGSAGILPITYAYIRMMGAEGLTKATKIAILNANYLADRLQKDYKVLFRGAQGRVAHELIIECRDIKEASGITETDIAKRLIDYGFHAPTLSFPIYGTLMIEPTESESKDELDRFVEALVQIREEIREVEKNVFPADNNVLVNAPHPEYEAVGNEWNHPYSREKAVYPSDFVRESKFWVNVARIDNAFGDRNLVSGYGCCACS